MLHSFQIKWLISPHVPIGPVQDEEGDGRDNDGQGDETPDDVVKRHHDVLEGIQLIGFVA